MQMTEVRDKLQLLQEVLTEKYSIEKDVEEAPRRLSSQEELLARLKKEYLEKNSVYEECKERVKKSIISGKSLYSGSRQSIHKIPLSYFASIAIFVRHG